MTASLQTAERRPISNALLAALIFVLLTGIYSLTYSGTFKSGDELLFVSGAQSLGALGELNLGPVYVSRGAEAVFVEPAQALVGAALYQLTRLNGVGTVHLLFLMNIYATALTGSVVFLLARQHGHSPGVAAGAALVFGLTTIVWPLSKTYFRDPLAMLFVALAAWSFELTYTRRSPSGQMAQWGVTLALLIAGILTKNTAAVAAPALLAAALADAPAARSRRLALIGLATMLVLIGIMWMIPAEGLFAKFSLRYYWAVLSGTHHPHFGEAIVGLLVSPGKGLFVESPALLLALLALPGAAWARAHRRWLAPWLMTIGLTLVTAYYQDYLWWGGLGWGVRHLLPVAPLLAVACAPALQHIAASPSRWVKAAGLGLVGLSGLMQVGGLGVVLSHYHARIAPLAPGAAWTLAIWNPLYAEVIGGWQMLLEGYRWDFGWVRLFPYHSGPVAVMLANLLALVGMTLVLLRWTLAGAPRRGAWLGGSVLVILSVSAMPYGLLRAYYPDPDYSAWREDFRQATDYVTRHAQPGDVIVVRGQQHPLWHYFINYARPRVPWYAINASMAESETMSAIQASRSPGLALDETTTELFREILPVRYTRLWLVNDFGSASGDQRLEEWWLAQTYYPAQTEIFSAQGNTAVSLFSLNAPESDSPGLDQFRFGETLQLVSYSLHASVEHSHFAPGDIVQVNLNWAASSRPEADHTVGLYLLDAAGALKAQQDSAPVGGFQPTSGWGPGEQVNDRRGLWLPADLPPGNYRLTVALYDWRTGARLPVSGPPDSVSDNLAYLTEIVVGAP